MTESTQVSVDTKRADLGGYESKMIDVNGVPTRYYDVGVGTPLVMLHGLGWRGESSGNTFVPLFPYLSQSYRLIVPDKLASGLTGNPPGVDQFTQEAQTEHMAAFVRKLDLGDEVFMLGQSRGGYLATQVALENQDIIKQLVVVNSASMAPDVGDLWDRRRKLFGDQGIGNKTMDDDREALIEAMRVQHEKLSYSYDHITSDFLEAKLYMEETEKSKETVRLWKAGGKDVYIASLERQKVETLQRLKDGELQMPVLISWGADDPSALLEQGNLLFQIMRTMNDRTRMITVNRAGHFHYREHPEEFSYSVRNFLEYWRTH